MNKVDKNIFYIRRNKIDELSNKIIIDYDGTIESFNEAIGQVKKSVELKSHSMIDESVKILEHLSKNFNDYLISEVYSVIINRNDLIVLEINNTSKTDDNLYCIKVYYCKELINEIDAISNITNTTFFTKNRMLILGFGLLILYKIRYL
jgi:hypothetical protein